MSPWSHSAGRRATRTEPSSKVRVYERTDVGGIFMARSWALTPSGRPEETRLPDGVDRESAKLLADLTAAERRKDVLAGRTKLGTAKPITLDALIQRYHRSAVAKGWSDSHRGDKDRGRKYWVGALRTDMNVLELTREKVVAPILRAMDNGMSPRVAKKRLSYIRAAVLWGRDESRLYDTNPLQGLKIQKVAQYEPNTEGLIYSVIDASSLLQPHDDVDWRATLAANIAYDTGRRITAILALTTEDVKADSERIFLHFRKEFDKANKDAHVPISRPTGLLLADALEQDVVKEFGWLFPEGRLDYNDPRDKPWSKDSAIDALTDAEGIHGIGHVTGRAYHGLKRTHVTTSMELSHGDTELVGDLTGNLSAELLRKVYRFGNRGTMARHVDAIRGVLEAGK